jgi:hypothetical protein
MAISFEKPEKAKRQMIAKGFLIRGINFAIPISKEPLVSWGISSGGFL